MSDRNYEEALQRASELQERALQERLTETARWQQHRELAWQEVTHQRNVSSALHRAQQARVQLQSISQMALQHHYFDQSLDAAYRRLLHHQQYQPHLHPPQSLEVEQRSHWPEAEDVARTGGVAIAAAAAASSERVITSQQERQQQVEAHNMLKKSNCKKPVDLYEEDLIDAHPVQPSIALETSTTAADVGGGASSSSTPRAAAPSPPPHKSDTKTGRVATRYSWEELGLGERLGTPAYNSHRRAKYQRLGLPPPEDFTAEDLAQKVISLQCKTVYLPADTPLQPFVETLELDSVTSPEGEPTADSTGSAASSNNLVEIADDNAEMKESQLKRKNSATASSDVEVVGSNKPDHSSLLHHSLGRLYHTMCRQDAEDYSRVRRESYNWNAHDLKKKLQNLPKEIAELEEREKKIIKESKLMGNTNAGVMEEAYRLLGVVPPEGC